MLEQLVQINVLLANLRQNIIMLTHENEELRKLYTQMKNDYDECKRNLEKTSQETSNSES
jgi:predicted  nucleic acid-binding Zn-ribbon protein